MTAGGDSACRDKDSFHLAVAQSPAGLNGSSARLDWLEHQLNAHAADKFDMLVLPELFACGYNIGGEVVAVAEPANWPAAIIWLFIMDLPNVMATRCIMRHKSLARMERYMGGIAN